MRRAKESFHLSQEIGTNQLLYRSSSHHPQVLIDPGNWTDLVLIGTGFVWARPRVPIAQSSPTYRRPRCERKMFATHVEPTQVNRNNVNNPSAVPAVSPTIPPRSCAATANAVRLPKPRRAALIARMAIMFRGFPDRHRYTADTGNSRNPNTMADISHSP